MLARALRSSVLGLGSVQVLVCSLVFGAAVYAWGVDLPSAVIIAGALAFSSTAIVTRELSAGKRVHTRPGQLAVGVLLFQDGVAVFFLILVPVLASGDGGAIWRSAKRFSPRRQCMRTCSPTRSRCGAGGS